MKSLTVFDTEANSIIAKCCATCKSIPVKADWDVEITVLDYAKTCNLVNMTKESISNFYKNKQLVDHYQARHQDLEDFVLLPFSNINFIKETIIVCKECWNHMTEGKNKQKWH